ncbi:cellulase family glycosylhydrolase [Actinopolymorpha pittospori]|uniref:cellulase n=1 Tax=Actinopolymorpha pittospori TaxID=648752 RepID=A0A927RKA3_9ACTN|nr:endoglucanase [Actinopolymorpha pittospori]
MLVASLIGAFAPNYATAQAAAEPTASAGPLHAEGSKLFDANGKQVTLTGVNWFGFETNAFAPHGLWTRNWKSMLDQMKASGFNTIRLPYSNQLFDPASKPAAAIDYHKNPDLKGLHGLALMDKIVDGATDRGLMVLLDQHRPDAQAQSELWYTDHLSEDKWVQDWTMLARHYRDNPLVIGADLHNEPHGRATWGTGDKSTDWRLAAERAGNAVLKANPNWLIVVEGIDSYNNDGYWWGGNLMGAKDHPVRLSEPNKLVYSAHDYGPGVSQQSWFGAPNFPDNMAKIWKDHWAYLAMDGTAPVLMGEFGGRSVSPSTTEGKWQHALANFLKQHGISYTYWSWNPNSGDTGGVLKDDWKHVQQQKLDMLKGYQAPRLGEADDRRRKTSDSPAMPGRAEDGIYVVRPGDTLDGIARRNHVLGGWRALQKLNQGRVTDPALIRPDQRLHLQ